MYVLVLLRSFCPIGGSSWKYGCGRYSNLYCGLSCQTLLKAWASTKNAAEQYFLIFIKFVDQFVDLFHGSVIFVFFF